MKCQYLPNELNLMRIEFMKSILQHWIYLTRLTIILYIRYLTTPPRFFSFPHILFFPIFWYFLSICPVSCFFFQFFFFHLSVPVPYGVVFSLESYTYITFKTFTMSECQWLFAEIFEQNHHSIILFLEIIFAFVNLKKFVLKLSSFTNERSYSSAIVKQEQNSRKVCKFSCRK